MQNNWRKVPLKDYCIKIGSGATPRGGSSVYKDSGEICLIRSQNIYNEGFKHDGLVYIDEKAGEKLNNVVLEPLDILLNITGDSVARVCLVDINVLPARVNQHVAIIRPKPSEFDARFLRYYLASPYAQKLLLNLASAGATRNALTKSMIEGFEVPQPKLEIQTYIADHLETLDNKIQLNQQTNQTLEQMAQALFKSWFVDFDPVVDNALAAGNPIPDELDHRVEVRKKAHALPDFQPLPENIRNLFPSEFEQTGEPNVGIDGWMPKGWICKPVSQALIVNPKVKLSKGEVARFADMKAIPTNGFHVEDIIEKEFNGGAKFQQNDVLLARITPCLENGKTALVDFLKKDEVGFGSTEFIVLRGCGAISYPFVACLSRLDSFRQHCIQNMVGSSRRQRVQNSCFDSFFLSLPKDERLLTSFDRVCKPMFEKMTVSGTEIKSLAKMRDTLLPRLISGELKLNKDVA